MGFIAWIEDLVSKILPYILAAGAALGALLWAKKTGVDSEKLVQNLAQLKQNQEALHVTQTVTTLSDADVSKQLRQFYRD